MDLKTAQCQPCHNDAPPLTASEYPEYLKDLQGWEIATVDGVDRLVKTYTFRKYPDCLSFAMAVGTAAEDVGHHPDMELVWGKVKVSWWTHNIRGLHLNDFIMAARTDDFYPA